METTRIRTIEIWAYAKFLATLFLLLARSVLCINAAATTPDASHRKAP